jgi:hypothetical protein
MNAIVIGEEAVQVEYWPARPLVELLRGQEGLTFDNTHAIRSQLGSAATQETLPDVRTGLDQLALVVGSIRTFTLPIQSAELLTLARQVVRATEGRPASNLHEWADRLADDLSKPND